MHLNLFLMSTTGLYKGMTPSIWKAGVTSAINFCIYDNIVAAVIRADH